MHMMGVGVWWIGERTTEVERVRSSAASDVDKRQSGAVAIATILSGIASGTCSTSSTEAVFKEELGEAVVQAVAELGVAKALLWVLCWARAG